MRARRTQVFALQHLAPICQKHNKAGLPWWEILLVSIARIPVPGSRRSGCGPRLLRCQNRESFASLATCLGQQRCGGLRARTCNALEISISSEKTEMKIKVVAMKRTSIFSNPLYKGVRACGLALGRRARSRHGRARCAWREGEMRRAGETQRYLKQQEFLYLRATCTAPLGAALRPRRRRLEKSVSSRRAATPPSSTHQSSVPDLRR